MLSQHYDHLIIEMIAVDLLPFSFVENDGFKRLMSKMCPKYRLKTRNYYKDRIFPQIFEGVKRSLVKKLAEAEFISFTTDTWSDVGAGVALMR